VSKKISYDEFLEHITFLENNNILSKDYVYGYKKSFKDFILDNNLGYKKNNCIYILSVIDNIEYCFTNGKFKIHLCANNISEIEYIKMCNIVVPSGYVFNIKCDGKNVKSYFNSFSNGDKLFYSYRVVLSSVSWDYKKLMLFYGIPEYKAKEIADKKSYNQSMVTRGKRNNSFGKRGMNANCFKPFIGSEDPLLEYSNFLKSKNKILILKWASDNDVDESCFEKLKFIYYSEIFKKIHIKKGEEYQSNFNLEAIEQGVYLYNKEKSIKNYNSENFIEYNTNLINLFGNKNDKEYFNKCLDNKEYEKIMSLCLSLKSISNWGKRVYYNSKKYGNFSLRSKLEKGFIFIVDKLENIESIKYENIHIPYFNLKNKTYYIDFEIILDNGKKFLIEVKPYNQCVIPEGEILLKKEAAEQYSEQHSYIYLFITEKDMKYELIRKKLFSS